MRSLVLVVGNEVAGALAPYRDKQWYSWRVGGCFNGWLKLRDGGNVDVARKGDVDWGAMADASASWAAKDYDRVSPEFDDLIADAVAERDAVARGETGASHECVDLCNRAKRECCDFDRDAYISQARRRTVGVSAIVVDGQWKAQKYDKTVAWDECVNRWCDEAAAILSALPDDAVLTVVDCTSYHE